MPPSSSSSRSRSQMNSLATPPYDSKDYFDSTNSSLHPSPALLAQPHSPPATGMRAVLSSTWGVLDQPPPPTLREILAAYKSRGDGDRDMLLAMLNAKSAEDQRQASLASLHRTLLELHHQTSSEGGIGSPHSQALSPPPPQTHLQAIASASAASPPFGHHPHLPPPPQQPQYASASASAHVHHHHVGNAQSTSPHLFAHAPGPDLERVQSSHGHSSNNLGGGITSPRITLPAIREQHQHHQRAILPAGPNTDRDRGRMSNGALPPPPSASTSTSTSTTSTASKRKRTRLSPGPGPSTSSVYAPSSSNTSRRAYNGPSGSTSIAAPPGGEVPPSPTPSSSRSHTTASASRRSISPDHDLHDLRRQGGAGAGGAGGAMAIGSLLSAHSQSLSASHSHSHSHSHSSGGSNSGSHSGGSTGSTRHTRRRLTQRLDIENDNNDDNFRGEDEEDDADELETTPPGPGWKALSSRPSSGSDRERERERYHQPHQHQHQHHGAHSQSHRASTKSRSGTATGGRARPPASRPSD